MSFIKPELKKPLNLTHQSSIFEDGQLTQRQPRMQEFDYNRHRQPSQMSADKFIDNDIRREKKKLDLQRKLGNGTSIVDTFTGDAFQKLHIMRSEHRRNNTYGAGIQMKKIEYDLQERKGADKLQNNGKCFGF